MASQRTTLRAAAAKAAQKIQTAFQIWNAEDADEDMVEFFPNEQAVKAVAPSNMNPIDKEATKPSIEMQPPNVQPANTRVSFTESVALLTGTELEQMQWQEKQEKHEAARIRAEHLRRCAARRVHSSHKLELSRTMSYVIRNASPKFSPIRGLQLSPHFKYSKVVKITCNTRKALVTISIK